MENFHFGKNLESIRKKKKPKKGQSGMAADLNMSQSRLSKIESESHVQDDDFVSKASSYLEVSRQDLLPPSWFIEPVKRKVYVLNAPGHGFYIFFITGFAFQAIRDIANWPERSAVEKVLLVCAFVLAGIAIYWFTVRKVEITEY